MIAVNIQGGLGNQLFEYAYAYSVSKELSTGLLLDNLKNFIAPLYFKISKWYIYIDKIPYLRRLYRNQVSRIKDSNMIDQTDCWQPQVKIVKNNVYYDGFFQSVNCFAEYQDDIKRLFSIRKVYRELFDKKYGQIYRDHFVVAIHVRRGDYLTHGIDLDLGSADVSLPAEYYLNALNSIQLPMGTIIVVTGDDIEWEKEHFSHLPNVIFASNEMIVDFQILMNANIVIASNSTFAWWASYLNNNPIKKIIMPKYFLGYHVEHEFPNGIYNNIDFEQVEVSE